MTDSPWDEVGPALASDIVFDARMDVDEALNDIEETLRDGKRPTAAQVATLRRQKDALQILIEESLAALADGTEPWGQGPGDHIPYWVLKAKVDDGGRLARACADGGQETGGDDEH